MKSGSKYDFNYFILIFLFIILGFLSFIYFLFLLPSNWHRNDPLKDNLPGIKDFSNYSQKIISISLKENNEKIINNNLGNTPLIPTYFWVRNDGRDNFKFNLVLNNKNWLTNEGIVATIMGEEHDLSSEDKALKIFQYLSENICHFEPPFYDSSQDISNPINLFNIFGYGWCDNFARSLAVLAEQAGLKSRVIYLNEDEDRGHVVTEIFYDKAWHMFDADRDVFYRKVNGEIASVADVFKNPTLLNERVNLKNSSLQHQKDTFFSGKISSTISGSSLLETLKRDKLIIPLEPGEELKFYYEWKKDWFWADFSRRPPHYTNGLLICTLNRQIIPRNFIKHIELPYPILAFNIYGKNICPKAVKILFSLDKEKWINLGSYCQNDVIKIVDVFPKGKGATITNQYYLKFERWLSFFNLKIYTQFQVAPNSIPKLQEGKNNIELKDIGKGKVRISFVFGPQESSSLEIEKSQ